MKGNGVNLPLRRRFDRLLITVGAIALIAIGVGMVIGYSVLDQSHQTRVLVERTERNAHRIELAVCGIVTYAERNAALAAKGDPTTKPPRPPNPAAAKNLLELATQMRSTGIGCSPRS